MNGEEMDMLLTDLRGLAIARGNRDDVRVVDAVAAEVYDLRATLNRLTDVNVTEGDESEHDWDRMLICRKCGQGMNAGDLIDGERPCIPREQTEGDERV